MAGSIRSFAIVAVVGMGLAGAPAAMGQEATPSGGQVIDPAECQVEARGAEDIEALAGAETEDDAQGTPAISEIGGLVGDPADEATVEAVTATYRELVACLNAGDYLRIYALYTDAYLQRTVADGGVDMEAIMATPATDATGSTALVSVSNVRRLEDGRVAARVETSDEATTGTVIVDAVLVEADERYLIDASEVVDAPTLGTPEA